MADILPTAQGSLEQDILLVKEARYGRDVRAAIAEGFELLSSGLSACKGDITELTTKHDGDIAELTVRVNNNSTDIESIKSLMGTVTPGFTSRYVPGTSGVNYRVYRWMNGDTSYDKITKDPSLAGTDIQIGDAIYTYNDTGLMPGLLDFKEYVDGCQIGETNTYGHSMPCGYRVLKRGGSISSLKLYDENETPIAEDSDGDIEQCAILYDSNYGVKGFKTDKDTKVYIQDLLNRIAALEAKVK